MSTYIFYHIYCNELTENIVKDQITNILFSGLYDTVDGIYCFLTGEKELYINNITNLIHRSGKKFIIKAVGLNDKSYERFTIHKIRNYIKPEDKFLYIHSKGVDKLQTTQPVKNNIYDWRIYMEYFLIRHHKKCLELLDKYDTVGVNLYYLDFIHYSGNFWWSTGTYFLTLPIIENIEIYLNDPTNKYKFTENYIGLNNPNAYTLCDSSINHYNLEYPPINYINNTIV